MRCVGFDTSNYKTSVACFDSETGQAHMAGALLPVGAGELGLRQSDAVFAHTRALPEQARRLFSEAGQVPVAAVGVSHRPRAAEDSYMPCFLPGVMAGEVLGAACGAPVYAFSHQQGHVAAAAYGAGCLWLLRQPFLAWHLSGGTTELLLVEPDEEHITRETPVGGTTDLAAGQLIDRAGAALGLAFPAGPVLEELSLPALPARGFTPRVKDCSFSLSGVENQVNRRAKEGLPAAEIAAFVVETVLAAVLTATEQALDQYPGLPVLCAGGVMANRHIRESLRARTGAVFAPPAYAGDNALGPAILAAIRNEGQIIWTRKPFLPSQT